LSSRIGVPPSISRPYDHRLCVGPQALGLRESAFGDCDALLIENGSPHRASAVQFKRVKVSVSESGEWKLNKLGALPKAVQQANELHAVGFAHVWLNILVVTDLRALADASTRRFTPPPMIERVISAIPLCDLATEVGVTVCEITQIATSPDRWRGGSGGTLVQSINERPQPSVLTEKIADLFSVRPLANER
jgi:hypothetical protein